MNKLRPIAIYLPQYHPITENDNWWGKGFTEWTNVVKSKPRFKEHYQPHLPSDLGFYDLRLPEVRQAQADMAKHYGIYGFCYYHYWFNGRQILERPFTEVFESGKPDFPFMLCWANENWTRIWDGGVNEILIQQNYNQEDDIAHINHLIPFFKDKRYIKVNGRPVFIIYKDANIPNLNHTIATFRQECDKQNIDLYLCKFDRENGTINLIEDSNFDAAIEFQPLSKSLLAYKRHKDLMNELSKSPLSKFKDPKRYIRFLKKAFRINGSEANVDSYKNDIVCYKEFIDFDLKFTQNGIKLKLYPCVSPGFDNSSRRRGDQWAIIFHNNTPDIFKKWVEGKCRRFKSFGLEENFIFINAWNEWAEGNHLEPDEKWGLKYLEALKEGLEKTNNNI